MAKAEATITVNAPGLPTHIPPSQRDALDAAVQTLQAHKEAWVSIGVGQRLAIIDYLVEGVIAITKRWVEASLEIGRAHV